MDKNEVMKVAPKSTELTVASSEASGSGQPSLADQRRRRLVRGAAALAPVVLTLRSGGALAAASCTGAAKYGSVTLGDGGQIPDGISVVSTSGKEDVCFTEVTTCESNTAKLSTQPGSYHKLGVVRQGDNSKYYCTNGSNNQKVAILSSQSATSLVS